MLIATLRIEWLYRGGLKQSNSCAVDTLPLPSPNFHPRARGPLTGFYFFNFLLFCFVLYVSGPPRFVCIYKDKDNTETLQHPLQRATIIERSKERGILESRESNAKRDVRLSVGKANGQKLEVL